MNIILLDNFNNLLESINTQKEPFGFLAGGTNIMVDIKRDSINLEIFYNLCNFKNELNFIKDNPDFIEIGALTTLTEIIEHSKVRQYLPHFVKALESIGTIQVRNMATLAGNVAYASSIGDSIPALLCSEAKIKTISVDQERSIEINSFFLDYKKTALNKNELIRSILIPKNKTDATSDFFKVALRPTATISKLNMAYLISNEHARFASGGVSKLPVRLQRIEKEFFTKNLTLDDFSIFLEDDISPINDIRSTAVYRKNVLAKLVYLVYTQQINE